MNHLYALCVILRCTFSGKISIQTSHITLLQSNCTNIAVYSQNQKRTDMNKCKITHTGIEYAGDISHTESGIKCQEWNSVDSSYHVSQRISINVN